MTVRAVVDPSETLAMGAAVHGGHQERLSSPRFSPFSTPSLSRYYRSDAPGTRIWGENQKLSASQVESDALREQKPGPAVRPILSALIAPRQSTGNPGWRGSPGN